MTARNTSIYLGPELEAFVQSLMASGRFSSVSEVVRAALREFELHLARQVLRTRRPLLRTDEEHFDAGVELGITMGTRDERIATVRALQRAARLLEGDAAGAASADLLRSMANAFTREEHLHDEGSGKNLLSSAG